MDNLNLCRLRLSTNKIVEEIDLYFNCLCIEISHEIMYYDA